MLINGKKPPPNSRGFKLPTKMKAPGLSSHSPEDLVGSPRVPQPPPIPAALKHLTGASAAVDSALTGSGLCSPTPHLDLQTLGRLTGNTSPSFLAPPPRFVVQFHLSFKGFEKLWQGNQIRVTQPQAKENRLSLRAPRGTRPADTLIFALKNPRQTCLSKQITNLCFVKPLHL